MLLYISATWYIFHATRADVCGTLGPSRCLDLDILHAMVAVILLKGIFKIDTDI